jgi:hypothetical protein
MLGIEVPSPENAQKFEAWKQMCADFAIWMPSVPSYRSRRKQKPLSGKPHGHAIALLESLTEAEEHWSSVRRPTINAPAIDNYEINKE